MNIYLRPGFGDKDKIILKNIRKLICSHIFITTSLKQKPCRTVLCQDHTCSPNGKCFPEKVGDKYVASCECDEGYHGDKCEKGEWIKLFRK